MTLYDLAKGAIGSVNLQILTRKSSKGLILIVKFQKYKKFVFQNIVGQGRGDQRHPNKLRYLALNDQIFIHIYFMYD